MPRLWPTVGVLATITSMCCGQLQAQKRDEQLSPPVVQTLSPPLPPPWILFPRPNAPPSLPDAPTPDLGTTPGKPDNSKSRVKRALDRAAPRCVDAITHTCWSSPPGDPPQSQEEREFAKDMQVGDFNFKNKSYRGAELRFRDALNYKPNEPEAIFKLAESLNKLGEASGASENYEKYLIIQPDGVYAAGARAALQRLSNATVE